jgi:hypothetical protein
MTKATLEARISEAIKRSGSAQIQALLPEVEAAATAAMEKAETARQAALDPLLEPEKIAETRKASDDARFEADRLTAAADRLGQALSAAAESERQAALEKTGREAKALDERLRASLKAFDAKAGELADQAATITDLRARIARLNAALREGGRADLTAMDPMKSKARETGRYVNDPLAGLKIEGHWPRRATIAEWARAQAEAVAQ